MTDDSDRRIIRVSGSPYETGLYLGRAVRGRMEVNIERYLDAITARYGELDRDRLALRGQTWYRELPMRFQEEIQGLAEGANIPLERLIEFYAADTMLAESGCSGIICMDRFHSWVGRNNDWLAPELWGYATIREIRGRIPTLTFGMEGDIFSVTGINRERLWLHHNYLRADDLPSAQKPCLDYFVWVTEALETCRTIADVRDKLDSVDRTGGMMLFVVDGKTYQSAIYDCSCSRYRSRYHARWTAGTNHVPGRFDRRRDDPGSAARLQRIEELADTMLSSTREADLPGELINLLGDEGVEQRGDPYWTVYSAVACPAAGDVWYTFGGYPAARQGNWRKIAWPWS